MGIKRRALAALDLGKRPLKVLNKGTAIVLAMEGKAVYGDPNPSYATVKLHLDSLGAAHAAVKNGGAGVVEARDDAQRLVVKDMQQLKNHVQILADNDPEHGEALITGAGMHVRRFTPRQKGTFEARQGGSSGLVLLFAAVAATRASYHWQWSEDQESWSTLPATLQARTTISGLTPKKTHYFRCRPVTKDGEGEWSQVVSLFVL